MGKRKKIIRGVKITFLGLGIGMLGYTSFYALHYMHWYAKTLGYPGLYRAEIPYPFVKANDELLKSKWIKIANDLEEDSDVPGWPDVKEISQGLLQ